MNILLEKEIEKDLKQLVSMGHIEKCVELNKVLHCKLNKLRGDISKYELDPKAMPMYFSGDLESKVVFVELNPGFGNMHPERDGNKLKMTPFKKLSQVTISNTDDYFNYYKDLGVNKAEDRLREGKTVSNFDQKQWFFFRGVGIYDLKGDKPNHEEMKIIRKNNLQLEIIPYMSKRFKFEAFDRSYIEERLEAITKTINSYDRDFVFIVGGNKIISDYFGEIKYDSFTVKGRKTKVSIGFKKYENKNLFFLKSYKMIGFTGEAMIEYGDRVKKQLKVTHG